MDSRGHRQSPATSLGFCVHSELFGGEPAASGKNGVNTQPRVVLRAEPRGWGRLPLQEHPHIHALNPKLDPLVPEPRPPPNPPARAAACGPASPLRPSTLKQKNKLQPRPSQRAWSLEAECRRLSREGRVSRHTLSRRRRSEGPAVVFFVVVVIYFIKSFPFLFLLTLMDTS